MGSGTSAKRRAAVRRRRTLLAVVLLAAVAAAVLFVWRPWAAPAGPTPSTEVSAPAETTGAPETPAPSTSAAATPSPSPSSTFTPIGGNPTAVAGEPCTAEQIRVTPQTDRTNYAAEEAVQLSFTIENTGEAACSLDAGTGVQEYEVRTGDEVVYRWSDCVADAQEDMVTLEPATPQTTVPIEWDRTRSSSDTCTSEREQVVAGGASYNLSVRVGEFTSTESRQFILE